MLPEAQLYPQNVYDSLIFPEDSANSIIHIQNQEPVNEAASSATSNQETKMEPFTMYNDPSSSAYQSFPEFTLKPDITHFQKDQFNLRLLTDDSSLLWDSNKPSQLGIYDDGVSQVVKTDRNVELDQP